jgi:outer membrane immunogenic protein
VGASGDIRMKRILIVAMASLIAASRASAADLPVRPGAPAYYPVATTYDWGGGYIGINGGYAFGQSEWGSDPLNPSGNSSTGNFNVNGGLVGVTVGVSGQFGAFVLGAEGDLDWQGIRGTSASPFCTSLITSTATNIFTVTPPNPPVLTNLNAPAAGLSCKTASNWLGTFRARFGYAWDRVLLYGTAGGAGANVETALNGLPYQNNAEWGWTVGAGLEWAFAENWTFKVEYLFVDLAGNASCNHGYSCGYDVAATSTTNTITSSVTTTPATNSNMAVKLNENIVRVGVNFKFGH